MAYVEQDRVLRIVDYRNLGSEELGSVYESLLELHPAMNADAKVFELMTLSGNERRTSGSYYTPDSLVQFLVDSAVTRPVVEERLRGKKGLDAEKAVLQIKVCDPACGSGHFLIAAAHRLARHLARIRTGEAEPGPEEYQHALRDVISRCIYGVDLNPMAVELCKVSLWMEAIERGQPLSFLDHHIKCGNSLLGTTPALVSGGIPDDAFKAIEGDVRAVANGLKSRNRRERQDIEQGQGDLFSADTSFANVAQSIAELNLSAENSIAEVHAKQDSYEQSLARDDFQNASLLADTWCSSFLWAKDESDIALRCPTSRSIQDLEQNPDSLDSAAKGEVRRLSEQYSFFHWHIAFPDVFNSELCRGFDIVLGNPPWERFKIQEQEWFASRRPDIANARNAAQRRRMIRSLEEENPSLLAEYLCARRVAEGHSHIVRNSGLFPCVVEET